MDYHIAVIREIGIDAISRQMHLVATLSQKRSELKIGPIHSAGFDQITGYDQIEAQ